MAGLSSVAISESSEVSIETPTADNLFRIMTAVSQTKCETKRFELLKVSSETIRNMGPLLESNKQSLSQFHVFSSGLADAVQLAVPAAFCDRGHFIFEREDFQNLTERTEVVLSFINSVFELLLCNQSTGASFEPASATFTTSLQESLPHLLIILSSNMRNCLWSCDSVQKLTLQIFNQLRILFNVESLMELLQLDLKSKDRDVVTPSSCLLGRYLSAVCVRLTKDEWQANPTFVESFVWMLTQMMRFPHLSSYLNVVLPPALLFVDSHVTEQRVLGIQCLQHIAANVTNEQLRWYGQADVVYAALKHQIYSREPEIIQAVHPALLTVLPIIDRNPADPDPPHTPRQMDEVLSIVITSALTENGLILRRLHTQYVPDYISCLGLGSVRHVRNLVDLVSNYLEVCDVPEEHARFNALNILYALLQNAWPRVPSYTEPIVRSVLKLFQDLAGRSSVTSERVAGQLNAKALSCLQLLIEICPDVEACLKEVAQTPELNDVANIIHDLLEKKKESYSSD